ncbi:MAG: hypothetical protein R6U58_12650 [Bacteroidales bacterium]
MEFEKLKIENGKRGQAIRIPHKMKIDDDQVYLKKIGNAIFVIPFHDPWHNLIESVNEFTADFLDDRCQQDIQPRDTID